jgi:hypothetical protein
MMSLGDRQHARENTHTTSRRLGDCGGSAYHRIWGPTCCALPLALALLGLGTATSLTMLGAWITPYKGLVSLVAGIGIAAGFVLAYRPRNDRCGDTDTCTTPAKTWAMKAVLWMALLLLIGAIVVE